MNATQVNDIQNDASILSIVDSALLDDASVDVSNIVPFFAQEGYIIITRKQSFIPTFTEVINSFFTRELIIELSIILAIFFLMMFLNHGYDFNAAALDLLLFLLDMGISTPINKLSMRIMFMSATLFALIFNPVLQGQLTSLLSRTEYRNVETLQDLRNHNYHVYFSTDEVRREIYESNYWDYNSSANYLHFLKSRNRSFCLQNVKENSSIACVVDVTDFERIDKNTHLSNPFSFKCRTFTTDKNNPLYRKINEIALKLFETGHLSYAEKNDLHRILLARKKKIDKIKALRKYNQLDLEDCKLVYIAIALSSAWAILVFGVEITVGKLESRLEKRSKERELKKLSIRKQIMFTVHRIHDLA